MSQTVLPFVVEMIVRESNLLGKEMAVNILMVSRGGCVVLCPDPTLSQGKDCLANKVIFLG